MLQAVTKIEDYTAGISFETFIRDSMLLDATMMNFVIVGEAANHLPREIKQQYPDIQWLQIRGMRNAAVHTFFELDFEVVWDTIVQDAPMLRAQLNEIVGNGPPASTH